MKEVHSISILGAGNLAWHLALALQQTGHVLEFIYSRKPENAEKLASLMPGVKTIDHLDFSNSKSNVFIIAVKDDAIQTIAEQAIFPDNALVLHTSGTVSLATLNATNRAHGILYPLQSFSKSRAIDFKKVPLLLECSVEIWEKKLENIASTLSDKVEFCNSEKRIKLHLSAVFASNFVNHMLAIAKDIAEENKLSFHLLESLVEETVSKGIVGNPVNMQSGPAVRHDVSTMKAHLRELEAFPNYQKIYTLLSESIQTLDSSKK